MKPEILHKDETREYDTPERCAILELSNDENDPAVSIARARVEPGVITAWHRLDEIAERYVILSGQGWVEIGDLESREVESGDVVRIPAGVSQRIGNVGTAELVFLAICTPRFRPEAYVNLEQ